MHHICFLFLNFGINSSISLNRRLKKEVKCCMEELDCNVVVMKKSRPKVLRLNLIGSPETETERLSRSEAFPALMKKDSDRWNVTQVPNVTPASSPEHTSFTTTDMGTSSISSIEVGSSPKLVFEIESYLKKNNFLRRKKSGDVDESDSSTESEKSKQWVADILSSAYDYSKYTKRGSRDYNKMLNPMFDGLQANFFEFDLDPEVILPRDRQEMGLRTNVREIVSLSGKAPPEPPPLCSVCQHRAPVFGKPPRWFNYSELEHATDGFSKANFLAEGGYGSVHRGILPDGQVIAVKQHRTSSSQGDREFCSEVEVLSCAQHRNVVLLIGFCVEEGRRLLVYEYICNGSLDSHLYGNSLNIFLSIHFSMMFLCSCHHLQDVKLFH